MTKEQQAAKAAQEEGREAALRTLRLYCPRGTQVTTLVVNHRGSYTINHLALLVPVRRGEHGMNICEITGLVATALGLRRSAATGGILTHNPTFVLHALSRALHGDLGGLTGFDRPGYSLEHQYL
jgi:hypothetical protein